MTEKRSLEEWLALAWDQRDACPPPETFLEAEWQELDSGERAALERHAADCPACAAERELARAYDAPRGPLSGRERADLEALLRRTGPAAATPAETAGDRGRLLSFPAILRPGRRSAIGLAAAAAAVLAIGLLLRPGPAPPIPPPPPLDAATRGGLVEPVAPVGELADLPTALSWHAIAGADSYRVTIRAVDGSILWTDTVSGNRAALPGETRDALQRAVRYLWTVEALDGDGAVMAVAPPTGFRARPGVEVGAVEEER